jgi:ribosomal-protein-alanine N-acetyltransferase
VEEIKSKVFPELNTERLLLRQLNDSDALAISALRSDDAVNMYIDRPKQTSLEGALAFVAKINNNIMEGTSFYWALSLKGDTELIGTVCLFNFSKEKSSAELGYELCTRLQGQGIANEAVKRVITFAFDTTGFKILEACIHQNNLPSINLALRNNFKQDENRKEEHLPDYVFFELTA